MHRKGSVMPSFTCKTHGSRHDVCAAVLILKPLAASRCVPSLRLVTVVIVVAAAATAVYAETSTAVTVASAVSATDSCETLEVLLLRLLLSTLLCLCWLVRCA